MKAANYDSAKEECGKTKGAALFTARTRKQLVTLALKRLKPTEGLKGDILIGAKCTSGSKKLKRRCFKEGGKNVKSSLYRFSSKHVEVEEGCTVLKVKSYTRSGLVDCEQKVANFLCAFDPNAGLSSISKPRTSSATHRGPGSVVRKIPLSGNSAAQSSTPSGDEHVASKAIDGDTCGYLPVGTCTHTREPVQETPWWSAEMCQEAWVHSVTIQNRLDCCSGRLTDFNIMVDDEQCLFHKGLFYGRKTMKCTKPLRGRKITVKLSKDDAPLTICDLVVTGQLVPGAKRSCPAEKFWVPLAVDPSSATSSTYAESNGEPNAARAVDGNTCSNWESHSCTHTKHFQRIYGENLYGISEEDRKLSYAWWSVDMKEEGVVKAVVITNRSDCCAFRLSDFYVMVDEKQCAFHEGSFNGTKKIVCDKPIRGKKLTIKLKNNYEPLTLCEVEILG